MIGKYLFRSAAERHFDEGSSPVVSAGRENDAVTIRGPSEAGQRKVGLGNFPRGNEAFVSALDIVGKQVHFALLRSDPNIGDTRPIRGERHRTVNVGYYIARRASENRHLVEGLVE